MQKKIRIKTNKPIKKNDNEILVENINDENDIYDKIHNINNYIERKKDYKIKKKLIGQFIGQNGSDDEEFDFTDENKEDENMEEKDEVKKEEKKEELLTVQGLIDSLIKKVNDSINKSEEIEEMEINKVITAYMEAIQEHFRLTTKNLDKLLRKIASYMGHNDPSLLYLILDTRHEEDKYEKIIKLRVSSSDGGVERVGLLSKMIDIIFEKLNIKEEGGEGKKGNIDEREKQLNKREESLDKREEKLDENNKKWKEEILSSNKLTTETLQKFSNEFSKIKKENEELKKKLMDEDEINIKLETIKETKLKVDFNLETIKETKKRVEKTKEEIEKIKGAVTLQSNRMDGFLTNMSKKIQSINTNNDKIIKMFNNIEKNSKINSQKLVEIEKNIDVSELTKEIKKLIISQESIKKEVTDIINNLLKENKSLQELNKELKSKEDVNKEIEKNKDEMKKNVLEGFEKTKDEIEEQLRLSKKDLDMIYDSIRVNIKDINEFIEKQNINKNIKDDIIKKVKNSIDLIRDKIVSIVFRGKRPGNVNIDDSNKKPKVEIIKSNINHKENMLFVLSKLSGRSFKEDHYSLLHKEIDKHHMKEETIGVKMSDKYNSMFGNGDKKKEFDKKEEVKKSKEMILLLRELKSKINKMAFIGNFVDPVVWNIIEDSLEIFKTMTGFETKTAVDIMNNVGDDNVLLKFSEYCALKYKLIIFDLKYIPNPNWSDKKKEGAAEIRKDLENNLLTIANEYFANIYIKNGGGMHLNYQQIKIKKSLAYTIKIEGKRGGKK